MLTSDFEFFRESFYSQAIMIIPSKTRIMIVPDFGVGAGDETMVALKKAIENRGDYAVKVVDLQAVVRDEHAGEELT